MATFWFVSFLCSWLPWMKVCTLDATSNLLSASYGVKQVTFRPIKYMRTFYLKEGRVQLRGVWCLRLSHHPLSLSSSSSSSTSSSGCSAMAVDSFVLKLLRIARVCRRGQRWLPQREESRTASRHQAFCALPYFTCCSLFDPFCFRFRRPSYGFRPSRYSATASLDGFFSRGEKKSCTLFKSMYFKQAPTL